MPLLEDGPSQLHTHPATAAGTWYPPQLSISEQLLNKLKFHQHQLNITEAKHQPGLQQVTAESQRGTNTFNIHLTLRSHVELRACPLPDFPPSF